MAFTPFMSQSMITFYKDIGIPQWFYPRERCYLTRALMYRQKIDMNTFVLIVGNPRTSKSSFALRLCEDISRHKKQEFNVEEQLTFDDIKKFLNWSKDATDSVFILDETGTSLSPEQFWSLQQRVMRRFVQTQGFRRNILFWALPSIIFIQKGFRFMANYGVKTIRQGVVRTYKIVMDQLIGKGYFYNITTTRFKMCSKKTWNKYVAMKKVWNDENLQNDLEYLKAMETPDERQLLRDEKLRLSVKLMQQRVKKNKMNIKKKINPTIQAWS